MTATLVELTAPELDALLRVQTTADVGDLELVQAWLARKEAAKVTRITELEREKAALQMGLAAVEKALGVQKNEGIYPALERIESEKAALLAERDEARDQWGTEERQRIVACAQVASLTERVGELEREVVGTIVLTSGGLGPDGVHTELRARIIGSSSLNALDVWDEVPLEVRRARSVLHTTDAKGTGGVDAG